MQDDIPLPTTAPFGQEERLRSLRAKLVGCDGEEAFDYLVGYCRDPDGNYHLKPTKGKDAVNILHKDLEKCVPFSFIVNKSDLLFYIRKPALKEIDLLVENVQSVLSDVDVKKNSAGEITVKIRTGSTAEKVTEEILGNFPGGVGLSKSLRQDIVEGAAPKPGIGAGKAIALAKMKHSILDTVRRANGQKTEVTVKNKDLNMLDRELDALLPSLLNQQNECCAITQLPFKYEGDKNMSPSVDRIDSSGHYEEGNLQIVCRFINFWKQTTPDDEFRRLIGIVRDGSDLD